MKILVTVTDTSVGGITTSVYNFTSELCKRGHDVTFLDFSATKVNHNVFPNVKQIFLQGMSKYWKLGKKDIMKASIMKKVFLVMLGVLKKITNCNGLWNKIIFKRLPEKFDVAIAFRQSSQCYAFVLKKVDARKKIGFVHGDIDFMGDVSSWQPLMEEFDSIAYVSDSVRRKFISKYQNLKINAHTVYNMFDYALIKEKSLLPNSFHMNNSIKNIVTIARIDNSSKQIDWIPYICNKLKKITQSTFHWYVLGDGPDMECVKKLSDICGTEDVLSFVGNISNPYATLKSAYLGVLTSKTEGYPMTVMETLSVGVPMVVTNYDSASEQINNGIDGIIAELDIDSVARVIANMLDNKDGIYEQCKQSLLEREFNNDCPYNQFMKCI